jgi:hypothetical protein
MSVCNVCLVLLTLVSSWTLFSAEDFVLELDLAICAQCPFYVSSSHFLLLSLDSALFSHHRRWLLSLMAAASLCLLISALACLILLQMLDVPSATVVKKISQNFLHDLESFTYVDSVTGVIHPVICAICDGMPTEPQWGDWVQLSYFRKLCKGCKLEWKHLQPVKQGDEPIYPPDLLEQHRIDHPDLHDFILSPKTIINNEEEVFTCKACLKHMVSKSHERSNQRCPPPKALVSGNLIGDAPEELKCLTQTELDLVAAGRIDCQSYVFFAGCHQQIRGWHTIFRNRPAHNVSNLELLAGSGLKGTIVVTLCGPFTSTQRALVMKTCQVRPELVVIAFHWLKDNNFHYKDFNIPDINDIPLPIICDEKV